MVWDPIVYGSLIDAAALSSRRAPLVHGPKKPLGHGNAQSQQLGAPFHVIGPPSQWPHPRGAAGANTVLMITVPPLLKQIDLFAE